MTNILILVAFILFSPVCAYAYLDPGSGAVLINLLIAGVAALIFSLKGVFLRMIGRKGRASAKRSNKEAIIGILSEGRQYHASFEPIVNALINCEINFHYLTLDIEDKILDIDSEYMKARFLGYGNIALGRASILKIKHLICTTPNIGCKGYPIQKSPHVQNLIHVFHSINDLSMYRKGSLDYYDSVYMVGEFQEKSIRELEIKRSLKPKQLNSLGLPYLDVYQKDIRNSDSEPDPKTVLVASSWGEKGLFATYGYDFIKQLAIEGYNVIVRPHPQSYVSEANMINEIEADLSKTCNVEWDREISPSNAMRKARLLISDTSSIRFDFAFLYQRPVISLEVEVDDMPGFEREDMSELWMDEAATNIGIKIGKPEIAEIGKHVESALQSHDNQSIVSYRDSVVCNYGRAGEAIATYIKSNIIGES